MISGSNLTQGWHSLNCYGRFAFDNLNRHPKQQKSTSNLHIYYMKSVAILYLTDVELGVEWFEAAAQAEQKIM